MTIDQFDRPWLIQASHERSPDDVTGDREVSFESEQFALPSNMQIARLARFVKEQLSLQRQTVCAGRFQTPGAQSFPSRHQDSCVWTESDRPGLTLASVAEGHHGLASPN